MSGVPTRYSTPRAACARPVAVSAVVAVPSPGSAPGPGGRLERETSHVPSTSTTPTPGGGELGRAAGDRESASPIRGPDARRTAPSASRALSAVSTSGSAQRRAHQSREPESRTSRSRGACVRRTRVSVPSRAAAGSRARRAATNGTTGTRQIASVPLSEHVPGR